MTYLRTIYIGLALFPFIAEAFTLPYVFYQYHKHGAVSKYRTLIIYSFILYMMIAFFMTVLPLPSLESTIGNTWKGHLNLVPFRSVMDYWTNRPLNVTEVLEYLKSFSLWQLLLNVILTMPFGIYLHYYFRQSRKRTVLFAFALSLFFEVTQITGLYGIYPGPYRVADVDDLICNTLGGLLGFQVAYAFMKILPARDSIDEYCRRAGKRVSGLRRCWAILFDAICCYYLYLFLCGAIELAYPGLAKWLGYDGSYFWTLFCLVAYLQTRFAKGTTLGHAVCRTVLVAEDGSPATKAQLAKRYLCLWMLTELPIVLFKWGVTPMFGTVTEELQWILTGIPRLYLLVYAAMNLLGRGNWHLPHDRISKTVYMAIEPSDSK